MRSQGVIAFLSTALVGSVMAQEATITTNNPAGIIYKGTLPEKPFFAQAAISGNVKGSITAETPADGKGVKFTVKFENLPKEGGPFTYHLHVEPATDGNCTSTLGHLDPFNVGETHVCDASKPAECQVGDLSGKHGKITSDPFTAEYTDLYASTQETSDAYFGDRSFVVHYANKTRLTCANFVKQDFVAQPNTTTAAPSGTAAPTGTGNPSPTTHLPFPGAASTAKLSLPLMGGVMAMIFFAL
ncbi:Cell surface Cu-only superoxide dismutase [Cladobotryum mycophilum]|uniref:Cell surface Cu-only superoxide dismutase n=1 Tax=Cladobotryum mycophilum TaxID=491253 RepID=A0ABR0SFZ9_9HYPO